MELPPRTFEVATTDRLTNLLSAAYFRHLFRTEVLPAAQHRDEPVSLVLLDLDNFKHLNDHAGPERGDAVLLAVAQILQQTLPASALLVRYGGDEFGALLPDTRADDAFTLLEDVRRQVAALQPHLPELPLTCSIGLAAFPTHAKTEVELMREADQALYLAKSTGRNKIALPPSDSRMITKTSYYTATQLERLSRLSKALTRNEASVLREALDDILKKYDDRFAAPAHQQ